MLMGSHHLPSPPAEDSKTAQSKRGSTSSASSKQAKQTNRVSKRAAGPSTSRTNSSASSHSAAADAPHHDHMAHSASGMDGRHKRVWKACERCRMKKTKCDGEFPCKRCKDDGLVCTAGVRKKVEYKQLPKGYAEVLENTQFALIATVHKLYSMVRNSQPWELGEPELNDRGQPVIHNIAQKLGCIRPNSDIDLPVHSVFPEDERGMRELAMQLEEQQQQQLLEDSAASTTLGSHQHHRRHEATASLMSSMTDATDHSDLDHSDFEQQDYRALAFGGGRRNNSGSSTMTMSPRSFTTSNTDFDLGHSQDLESPVMFPSMSNPGSTRTSTSSASQQPSPAMVEYAPWPATTATASPMPLPAKIPDTIMMQFLQQEVTTMRNMDIDTLPTDMQNRLMNQGLVESHFGTLKPHVLTGPNSEVMMGMGDPMIYSGSYDYDGL